MKVYSTDASGMCHYYYHYYYYYYYYYYYCYYYSCYYCRCYYTCRSARASPSLVLRLEGGESILDSRFPESPHTRRRTGFNPRSFD